MESGDLFNAFRCWAGSNIIAYCSGYPLPALLQSQLMNQLKHYRLQFLVLLVEPFEALMAHLSGTSTTKLDWDEIRNADPTDNSQFETLKWSYWCWHAVQLAYYFGKLEIGYKLLAPFAKISAINVAYFSTSICIFFSGLTCTGLAKQTGKRKYIKQAQKETKKMKRIMQNRGLNNLHRYMLMQADLLAATNRRQQQDVKMAFDKAIATAGKAGFVQDAALGNELALEYFVSIGDGFWPAQYLGRACELYYEWGALAKLESLTEKYASYMGDSRITFHKGSHLESSSQGWFSGEGSTKLLETIDLDCLDFTRTPVNDVTKGLSATVEELRNQQQRRSISSKESL